MRLIVLVVALLLRAIPLAEAQQAPPPEALTAARELMAVMSPDMINQLVQGLTTQIWPNLERQIGSRVDQTTLAEMRAEFERSIQQFGTTSMQDAPAIYARYFSAEELHAIADFYKTPAGAKALQLMPKVMSDYFATMMPRMNDFQHEVQSRIQAILQRHGYQ
jgi:hypothetical protein